MSAFIPNTLPVIMHIFDTGPQCNTMPPTGIEFINDVLIVKHSNADILDPFTISAKLPLAPYQMSAKQQQAKQLDCNISILLIILICVLIAYLFHFAFESIIVAITIAVFGISVAVDEFLKVDSVSYNKVVIMSTFPDKETIEMQIHSCNGIEMVRIMPRKELSAIMQMHDIEEACTFFEIDATLEQKKILLFVLSYSTVFFEKVDVNQLNLDTTDGIYYTPWYI